MLTHGNLLANLDQIRSTDGDRLGPDDVVFGVLPLNHIMGLNVVLLLTLPGGRQRRARAALRPGHRARHHPRPRRDGGPRRAADVGGVVASCRRSRWRRCARCASPPPARPSCPSRWPRRCRSAAALVLREGYGLTEASPVVTTSSGIEPRRARWARSSPDLELRLVDPDGDDALAGDPGEIWVRGANVFLGYWNDPEATARVLTADGWLRTGDVAVADDDGYLYLVDRAKDLIIVSRLQRLPGRGRGGHRRATRRGRGRRGRRRPPAHGRGGQGLRRAREPGVRPRRGGRDRPTASDHLARYKCPTKVLFVDELPRTSRASSYAARALTRVQPQRARLDRARRRRDRRGERGGDQEAANRTAIAGTSVSGERRVLAEAAGERAAGREHERAERR